MFCGCGAIWKTHSVESAVVGGSNPLARTELAGMAQVGRRGSFKNCMLKVRILLPASAVTIHILSMNTWVWRNPEDAPVSEAGCWRFKSSHPHLISVGVAQLGEREPAMLEVGSSSLLADSCFLVDDARLAEWR